MTMPTDVGIIDTMIGFPAKDFEHYEFIRKQLKDSESANFDFPWSTCSRACQRRSTAPTTRSL